MFFPPDPPQGCAILSFEPVHLYVAGIADQGFVRQSREGPAFTMLRAGRVAALFGLVIPWPGLAEAWLLATPELAGIGHSFTYFARRFFAVSAAAWGLRRIQVHVDNSNVAYLRWARAAGFRFEAVIPCYGPNGEDMALMSRIFR